VVPDRSALRAADLSAALEEQRRRLEQAYQAQKLESLGLLAGGMAHEFNNLLASMLTAADLLRRDLPLGSEPHQLAELIRTAADRATSSTRRMLLYAGKGTLSRTPLAFAAAAEECLTRLGANLPKNVALVRAFAPELPPVLADPALLAQLITSLVVNAVESLGAEGGSIFLTTGVEETNDTARRTRDEKVRTASTICPPSFVLRPSQADRHVYFEVSDDGCGMTAEVLARSFDPFFSTKGRGRGLGLCWVLGGVRAHGGGLCATSAPGAGTTVRVLLPAAATAEARADAPPSARVVLVIDDEPIVRGVTSRTLARMGLQVMSAGAGEGVELFRAHREAINLVVLDLGPRGQEGLWTFAALRAERPDLPVILTSASDPGHVLDRPGLGPTVGFLSKPYTVPALIEAIDQALAATA
jgi:signal transduction histidine kinase/CheY-like chemotaxis protein